MHKTQRKNANKISIHQLMFLCIITTIIVSIISFSRYKTSVATDAKSKVAVPIIELNAENSVLPINISPSQSENIYTFKVANNDGENESEVSMEYTLQINSLGNLPLDFELYNQENENVNLLNENKLTETIQLNVGEEPHIYNLKIKWKEDRKSYEYSQTIDYIQVVLKSQQKD